jgi:hypothetical protein
MTPKPRHPSEIKTPSTSIGIPENQVMEHDAMYAIGAICGIVALIVVLAILL